MRSAIVLLPLVLSVCTFDSSSQGRTSDDSGVADASADAQSIPDALPLPDASIICSGNETRCLNGALETCDGTAWPDSEQAQHCSFACVNNDHCISASNLSEAHINMCDGNYQLLTPGGAAKLQVLDNTGIPEIACDPDCGDGSTIKITGQVISATETDAPDMALFCLSTLNLPEMATLGSAAGLPWSIVLVVRDEATLAGTIDIAGGDGVADVVGQGGGPGGSGGGMGGNTSTFAGNDGVGPCAGKGGEKQGEAAMDNYVGGGGGGGGFRGVGGVGGGGRSTNNDFLALGGAGGTAGTGCGTEALIPLVAGSGGGGGGDGSTGVSGWPGGGGGGAIQISSKTSIVASGTIIARGGNGFGNGTTPPALGGGGGGGSGGAVLLEAPLLTISGMTIDVGGGNGGPGSAGPGGDGGADENVPGEPGTDEDGSSESGGGGGGGGGLVRLNATIAPACEGVSPVASCTSGTM